MSLYTQEISIPTTFYQDGTLYENLNERLNELLNPIIEFSENEKCVVIGYLGRDNYKILYKEREGIVTVDDLEVNEEMTDLYYEYQDKERLKSIEIKENRKQRLDELANKDTNEKALKEQEGKDSIARIVTAKKLIIENKKRDSIARVIAAQKVLKEQRVRDSIAESIAAQKVIEENQKRDSIARVIAAQKVLREQRVRDSIVKSIAAQKVVAENQKRDSIARVIAQQIVLKEQKASDSIAKSIAAQKVMAENQIRKSIARVIAEKKVLKEQRVRDSIAESILSDKAIEDKTIIVSTPVSPEDEKQEKESLEKLKFRETCHYTINEFDPFYNIKTVRTEAYSLAKNLTVELYKQGRKVDVFFNAQIDLGCVSYFSNNKSSVKVTLENNQTISFYHSWDMECGAFLFKGSLSKSQIISLKKSPIKSIRLKATKGAQDITNIDYKTFFIDKLKCIE